MVYYFFSVYAVGFNLSTLYHRVFMCRVVVVFVYVTDSIVIVNALCVFERAPYFVVSSFVLLPYIFTLQSNAMPT